MGESLRVRVFSGRPDIRERLPGGLAMPTSNQAFDLALAVDEVVTMLKEENCTIQADCGLSCLIHYWGDNERKTEPNTLAQLEQLEFALSGEYPYKLLARFFQVIARKA